jgi:hypothetical protein
MEDDHKKKGSESASQEEEQQITVFSNDFGHVERIIIPQLEVMARLNTWFS